MNHPDEESPDIDRCKCAEKKEAFLKLLDELIFIVAHRVRKPLSSQLGLLYLLELNDADPEKRKELISYLLREAKDLDACTHEMMEALSRVRNELEKHR